MREIIDKKEEDIKLLEMLEERIKNTNGLGYTLDDLKKRNKERLRYKNMREIKFRAWSKILNKMLSHEDLNKTLKDLTKIEGIEGIFLPLNSDVDIMQFTGLKDSNNKEIYEGDIIKIEDYFGDNIVGKVIYEQAYASYSLMEGDEKKHFKMSLDNLESYVHEIVGNIYENKELA